jgi:hypothetical protein
MKRIAEIASVSSGYHFRGGVNHVADGRYAVIQAKDVDDSLHFDRERLVRVNLEADPERYLVRQGDVVFLSRGLRPWALSIAEPIGDTVVPSSFYILRADPQRVRPEYLAWFLNHPNTQAKLGDIAKGSNIPFISMREFGDFPAQIPALKIQEKIISLARLSDREQQLLRELGTLRGQLVDAICFDLAQKKSA